MKYLKVLIISAIFLLIMTAICTVPAMAEGEKAYRTTIPFSVSNPDNNIPEGTVFKVIITTDAHAPLPDPSEMKVGIADSYYFNEIVFTEPGNYYYQIKQETPDDEYVIYDTNVFEVKVTVIRDENNDLVGAVIVDNNTGDEKMSQISFSNDYDLARKNADMNSGSSDPDLDSDDEDDTDEEKESSSDSDGKSGDNSQSDDDISSGEVSDPVSSGTSDTEDGNDTSSGGGVSPGTGEPISPAFGGIFLSAALFVLFVVSSKRTRSENED